MSKPNKQLIPQIASNFVTAFKAFKDPSTSKSRKFLAVGVVAAVLGYIALPVDLIPDFALGVGQVDDLFIALLSSGVLSWILTGDLSKERIGELLIRLGVIKPPSENSSQE